MTVRLASAFAIATLVPAGLNVAAWASPVMIIPVCGGPGSLDILLHPSSPVDGPIEPHDCPKGCHAGVSRKRLIPGRSVP